MGIEVGGWKGIVVTTLKAGVRPVVRTRLVVVVMTFEKVSPEY